MRILLIAALVSSVAVAGCGGGNKNSSTSANNSASANSGGAAATGAGGAGEDKGDAFRRMLVSQCESQAPNLPNPPPGVDPAAMCGCAIETAFGDQADPITYARSPEGQQALTQAVVSCGRQQRGAAGAAKSETK